MMWLDKKYLNLISHKLERFAWKGDRLANMRCPLCGDSHKNKLKARGYAFELKGSLMYKCHNCSASMSIPAFVKIIDETLYREYMMEKFGAANNATTNTEPKLVMKSPIFGDVSSTLMVIYRILLLSANARPCTATRRFLTS